MFSQFRTYYYILGNYLEETPAKLFLISFHPVAYRGKTCSVGPALTSIPETKHYRLQFNLWGLLIVIKNVLTKSTTDKLVYAECNIIIIIAVQ